MFKLLYSCTFSHASKVMVNILQARLQQYMNQKLPDVQGGFRKTEELSHTLILFCFELELPIPLEVPILWHSVFFMVQLSHLYMTTGKTTDLTERRRTDAFEL